MRHLRLYGGLQAVRNATGFASAFTEMASSVASPVSGPNYNLIYSITDTIVAKISKNKPRAEFLTDGGDYRQQRKAKKLNQFSEGVFYQTNFYPTLRDIIRDACVFGTGILKVFEDDGQICAERVFPNDVWVDVLEGANQAPANMFQVQLVDKGVLAARFPDKADEIYKARGYMLIGENGIVSNLANFVEVYEGWHLESSKKAGDGRRSICMKGVVLEDEHWTQKNFPFVFLRFSPPVLTFWGRGVSELLTPHQAELNRVCRVEAQSHRLMSVPKVWADYASGIDLAQLQSNRPMTIGFYKNGMKPEAFNWNATSENFVNYKNWIIDTAHQFIGVSRLSASSMKPAGIDSAVGLRELNDIEGDRFLSLGYAVEEFAVEVARRQIDLARVIYGRTKSYKVQAIGKRFVTTIDWADINEPDEAFYIKAWAASQLPQSPAGRKQFIQELLEAKLIDTERALQLLNLPDLQEYTAFYDAAMEEIDATIDSIIYDGKEPTPDGSYQNLKLGVKRGIQAYNMGKNSGVPQANLDKLMNWIQDAKGEAQRVGLLPPDPPQPGDPSQMPPPDGGGGGPPGQPSLGPGVPAVPQQPPVSQLMPMKAA